jgi:metallo-beta-lactamase class B
MKLPVGVLVVGVLAGSLLAQQAISPAAQRHIDAARTAAGAEHQAVWQAVCDSAVALANPPAGRAGGRAGGTGAVPTPPARQSWYAEPQKVFDNLYFVGMTAYSAWAITTSEGIILLDAIFDYSIEAEVDDGLRKLGLNPADIKYVVISHGHVDHAGGAKFLQGKYSARLLMSAADYDLLDRQNPSWKPKRDIVATDGQVLTLGDQTMTLYLTPGHTEGTISTIFSVRDGGERHTVATWGGTSFNFGPIRERLIAYERSATRFRDIAAKANADVILSNHTPYDGTTTKLPALKTRRPGDRHPYVVGTDSVQRYLTTVDECAQAAIEITAPRGGERQ